MAEFYEKPRSRKERVEAGSRTITRNWFCSGTTDQTEVYELALTNNPGTFQGLLRKSLDITPLGYTLWDVDVEYGIGKPTGISPDLYSFKIGNQSVHINQSLDTIFRRKASDNGAVDPGTEPNPEDYPLGTADSDYIVDYVAWEAANAAWIGTAADHKSAIGVTGDSVEGVDILVPKIEWSKTVQRAEITFPYLISLMNMVGKTNSKKFYQFPANTLLYLGCEPTNSQGQLADGTEFPIWTLTHQFAYERDRILIDIGDIRIPRKRGWEYLWAHFGLNPVSTAMTQPPDAVYVERVYEPGNFEILEIGTDF